MNDLIAQVILNVPAKDGIFDYSIPEELIGKIKTGCMVVVPFRQTYMQGIVLSLNDESAVSNLRPVTQLVDEMPVLTFAQLEVAKKLSTRCLAPLSDCVNVFLTEKIRKISEDNYTLVKKPDQKSISDEKPTEKESRKTLIRERLINLFPEENSVLAQSEIDQKMEGVNWKNAMDSLIREGIIRKDPFFSLPDNKLPVRRVAHLSATAETIESEWNALSRQENALKRRQELLLCLKSTADGIPVTDLLRQTGATQADIKALEKKHLISITEEEAEGDYTGLESDTYPGSEILLNTEQQKALEMIEQGLKATEQKVPILVHGVTGSGKTEIYIRATEQAIAQGKQVLVLVPEISLTPQILGRFSRRFPGKVGVYHSRLTDSQRYETWRKGRNGSFRIIIGPRSALAVPLNDLGLIIVDECHDDSYYQTERPPFFSAVQAASDYAALGDAQLVLGSATPTIAQVFKAQQSKWKIVRLKERASGISKPTVKLVDMRQELKSGNRSVFSRVLIEELKETLADKKQAILFLNRRGSAGYTFCHACGHDFRCPHCEIPLTWHQKQKKLCCHFCGYTESLPEVCPRCGEKEIHQFGTGVEQVENLIRAIFPSASILRMDSETTAKKGSYERILSQFAERRADILIGTQMVTKGLDFPGVRLVGVLLADVGMNFHDYRVDEHTFQILTQVTGRAGRVDVKGMAILQTYQPTRYSIQAAVQGDFDSFYKKELAYRREIGYPPFSRLVRIVISDPSQSVTEKKAFDLSEEIRKVLHSESHRTTNVIGPAPCFFPKLDGKYRWHIILRGPNPTDIIKNVDTKTVRVEVDPPSVL